MQDEERREALREFVVLLAAGIRSGVVPREDLEVLADALEAFGVRVSLPWLSPDVEARLVVRAAKKCGKAACTKCPHGPYVVLRRRIDGRVKETQLGRVGSPRVERRLRQLGLDLHAPSAPDAPSPRAVLPKGFLHDD